MSCGSAGQIVAGPFGLQTGLNDHLPSSWAARCHAEKFTDQSGVSISGRTGIVGLQLWSGVPT